MRPCNKRKSVLLSLVVGCIILFMTVGAYGKGIKKGAGLQASAMIYSCENPTEAVGMATLKERKSDEGVKLVDIMVKVKGLTEGKHAVHIHETAACEPCGSAGGHFDPGPYGFTSPDGNHPFHAGDLININVNKNGKGVMHTETSRVTLSPGPLSIFDGDGSAFIIHVDPDTYCPEGDEAGDRPEHDPQRHHASRLGR